MKRIIISGLLTASLAAVGTVRGAEEPDAAAVARGNREFALDLYAKLRDQDGNLFFSPYSISTALAMTRAGARGDTAAEMDKTLHFTMGQDKLNPAFADLIKQINGDPADKKRGYQFSTANALWGQKNYGFRPDFLKLIKDEYGARLDELDFQTATEQSRQTINAWVEKQTNDKIKELLHEGDVTALTQLVLTNAIYFKGDWAWRFKKDATKDQPFHLAAGKQADAPMMHQTAEYAYFENENLQALELPYSGKDLSMVVLLPRQIDGLADMEKGLTADKLAGWIGKLHKQAVIVTLPKFKTEQRVELKNTLSDMGMKLAFDEQRADLSGMAGKPGDLHISKVIHQAYIDVNEEGTEAAAATAVVIAAPSGPGGGSRPTPEFQADHPFVFLIRDTRNDSILFLGRLADPTK